MLWRSPGSPGGPRREDALLTPSDAAAGGLTGDRHGVGERSTGDLDRMAAPKGLVHSHNNDAKETPGA